MKIFSKKDRVIRYYNEKNWHSYQLLIRHYYIFKICFFKKIIDREDIPNHIYLGFCAFGDFSGWVSKFKPFDENGWK